MQWLRRWKISSLGRAFLRSWQATIPQFNSESFKAFTDKFVITHSTSSPGFPEAIGQTECGVDIAKRILCNPDPSIALMTYGATPVAANTARLWRWWVGEWEWHCRLPHTSSNSKPRSQGSWGQGLLLQNTRGYNQSWGIRTARSEAWWPRTGQNEQWINLAETWCRGWQQIISSTNHCLWEINFDIHLDPWHACTWTFVFPWGPDSILKIHS